MFILVATVINFILETIHHFQICSMEHSTSFSRGKNGSSLLSFAILMERG